MTPLLAVRFGAPGDQKRNWSAVGIKSRLKGTIDRLADDLRTRIPCRYQFDPGGHFRGDRLANLAASVGQDLPTTLQAYCERLQERPAFQTRHGRTRLSGRSDMFTPMKLTKRRMWPRVTNPDTIIREGEAVYPKDIDRDDHRFHVTQFACLKTGVQSKSCRHELSALSPKPLRTYADCCRSQHALHPPRLFARRQKRAFARPASNPASISLITNDNKNARAIKIASSS